VVATETSPSLTGKVFSNVLASGPAKMDFMTPLRVAAGYSYRPAPGWNIEANVEWLDWDALNNLTLFSPMVPGGAIPVPFQWDSMFIYEIGFSYTTETGYTFAAGYDYNSNAQPDTFYNPGIADADRHWLNAGFGQRREDWEWFLTYQFGYSNRTVTGALPNAAGQTANGKYESRHHAIVFSWQHRF
jgi:long-subunit fatty acid transport protein